MREDIPKAIKGAGALSEMLEQIGTGKDCDVAKVLVENETELSALLAFALMHLAGEQ